ncbi:cyanophycinase [Longilinea arvoryzae]|uniref:Cyanophycinase n=1 Tax=Longilinea arvoryzae TaxID=360412 RepID=A0A0S7BN51_9CHLR|nr:Type 1 glutamine amidotransferase-like domain-containing protein [Longilinea arvoryzae]GAP15435.1 cyanophycinase [Longilinea arvoryzae]
MSPNLTVHLPGPGLLALVGSGEYLPGMQPVDRWLMEWLDRPVNVVCLPTAAGTEGNERLDYWNHLGVEHFRNLGAASVNALPVIDRSSAENAAFADQIRAANLIYLSGGKPAYLHATLANTVVWQAIEAVLANGGVIAGCSAGAMIFGDRIPRARSPFEWGPAFGYLPGCLIMPHFDELPPFLKSAIPWVVQRNLLVGIEGYTALICVQSGFQVRGRGGVTLATQHQRNRYCQGDTLPA